MFDLALNEQLCFALYVAAHRFTRAYSTALAQFDLTMPQLLVLMALWEKSPLLVNELAALLDLQSGSVTPLLKRIEANGYLRRERDDEDERQVYIHATEKAMALRPRIIELKQELACTMDLDEEEVFHLRHMLRSFSGKVLRYFN